MKQPTLPVALGEHEPAMRPTRSLRSPTPSAASFVLLWLAATACGFPRPADLVSDASGGSDSSAGPIVAIHVSPSGDDANDGLVLPVRTLKHAIGLAAADTMITQITLATGTYSAASGETFPYSVPPNVTVTGPAGGGAMLSGDTKTPGLTVDVGGLQDVDLQDFTTAITATGSASLENIRVLTSTVAVQAETAANLTITNLDVTGTPAACGTGVILRGNAVLRSSTFATRTIGTSLLATDHSTFTLAKVNVSGDPACTNGALNVTSDGMFMVSDCLIDGSHSGVGISAPSGSGPASAILENVTVRNADIDALGVGNATVQMMGGELSHTRQTSFEVVGGSCTLTGVSISSSGAAFYSQDATLMMRGCTISNNTVGGDLGSRAVADFGTAVNPGNNVFNNIGVGLVVEGGNGTALVQVVGNFWKPVQGADANGKYAAGTVISGPISCASNSGNFCISVDNESLAL